MAGGGGSSVELGFSSENGDYFKIGRRFKAEEVLGRKLIKGSFQWKGTGTFTRCFTKCSYFSKGYHFPKQNSVMRVYVLHVLHNFLA